MPGEFIFEVRSGRCPVPCVLSVNELWQLDSGGKALFSGELDEQGTVRKNKGQVHCHSGATASRPE